MEKAVCFSGITKQGFKGDFVIPWKALSQEITES